MEIDYTVAFTDIQVIIPDTYKRYLRAKTYSFEELLDEIEALNEEIDDLKNEIEELKEDK